MNLFDRIKNFVTGRSSNDDGAAEDRRRREEEERRRREAAAAQRAAEAEARRASQPTPAFTPLPSLLPRKAETPTPPQEWRPPSNFTVTSAPGSRLENQSKDYFQEELDKINAQDAALRKKMNPLERFFDERTGDKNREERAIAAARNRVAQEAMARNDPQEDIQSLTRGTQSRLSKESQRLQKNAEDTQRNADLIRWLPGAGIGELGANIFRGNMSGLKDDQLLREQMNLSQAEVDALSADEYHKMKMIARAGLYSGLLDLAAPGVGSLGKNAARTGLKKGAMSTLRQGFTSVAAKDVARQMATKQGARTLAQDALIGGGTASAITGGSTLLMGGDVEGAIRNAGSAFLPGALGGLVQSPLDTAGAMAQGPRRAARNATHSLVSDATENIDAINKTQVNTAAQQQVQAAAQARQVAEQVAEATPETVEVAPGISSPNIAAEQKAAAEAAAQAARQAEADARAQAEAEAEITAPEPAPTPMPAPAPAPDPLAPRTVDPEVQSELNARAAEADQASEQTTQKLAEPTTRSTAEVKTKGRQQAEAVAEATPAPANPVSKMQKALQNVEADIEIARANGRDTTELERLRDQLKNDLADEIEFSPKKGARVTEEPSTPVVEKVAVKGKVPEGDAPFLPPSARKPVEPAATKEAPFKPKAGKKVVKEATKAPEPTNRLEELQNIPRKERTKEQSAELDTLILDGFKDVRKQFDSDEDFYTNFVLKEAEKDTRSADLAQEIVESVENNDMTMREAIDLSLMPDVPKSVTEQTADAISSLKAELRSLEKNTGQKGLVKKVNAQLKGKTPEEQLEILQTAHNKMRDSGKLAQATVKTDAPKASEEPFKPKAGTKTVLEPGKKVEPLKPSNKAPIGDALPFNPEKAKKLPPASRDLEEHADIDPSTNMPKEDLPFVPKSGTKVVPEAAPTKADVSAEVPPMKPQYNKDGSVNKNWAKKEKADIMASDRSVEAKAAAIAEIDNLPRKADSQQLQNRISTAETALAKAEDRLKDLRIKGASDKAIASATKAVETQQKRLDDLKNFKETPKAAEPTQERLALKPTEKQKEARREKRKAERKQAKAEERVLKGDAAGGGISSYLARQTANITGNAQMESDLKSVAPKGDTRSFKEDIPKQLSSSMEKTNEALVESASSLGKSGALTYDQKLTVIGDNTAISYRLDELASQKTAAKTKKAKNAIDKEIRKLQDAQGDLIEAAAKADQQHGRSMGLSGYLFKTLEPGVVSSRIIKKMEDKAPYSDADKVVIKKATEDLKKAFDDNDAVEQAIENSKKTLLNKSSSPEERKAALDTLNENLDGYTDAQNRLREAYNKVNTITEGHELKAIEEGKIAKPVTFGIGANRYQKLNMLSGVAGRLKDFQGTGLNAVDIMMSDISRALSGKIANRLGGKGQFASTVRSGEGAVKRGFKEGLRKAKNTFTGKEDTRMGLSATSGGRQGNSQGDRLFEGSYTPDGPAPDANLLQKGSHRVANLIRGGVAAPSHLFGEIYTAKRLNTAARDIGKKAGLTGAELDAFARAGEIAPSKEIFDAVKFNADEISGLQSKLSRKIDEWHMNTLYNHATWDGDKSKSGWRVTRATKQAKGVAITAAKNTAIPFTSWPLGAAQNMATRQNPLYHTYKAGQALFDAKVNNKPEAMQQFVNSLGDTAYSAAKVALVTATISPFLSDTDANGEGWNPPYIKIPKGNGEYWSNDLGILGPLAAPLVTAWAFKQAEEAGERGESQVMSFVSSVALGTLGKTGLANTLNAQGIPLIDYINRGAQAYGNPDANTGKKLEDSLWKTMADVVTQSIPLSGFSRDATAIHTSIMAKINPDSDFLKAPDTKALNEDGTRNVPASALRQIGSALYGVSELIPKNEDGKMRTGFFDKTYGTQRTNETNAQANVQEEKKVESLNSTLANVVGNEKYTSLLSEEAQKLLDKSTRRELTSKELETVRNDLADSKVGKKFMEEGDWDAYAEHNRFKLDKLKNADGVKDDSAIRKTEREISRAAIAKEHKVSSEVYRYYTDQATDDGGGISQAELVKLFDEDSGYTNKELGKALLAFDELLTEKELSANSDGPDPHKRPKYNREKLEKSLAALLKKKAGGGGGSSRTATSYGAAKRLVGEGFNLKYRAINKPDNPIPNLSAQTARTNLKKTISVKKGVHL